MQDRTVLFVDDEQSILNSLKRLMRKEGFNILTASSGKEGLDLLEKQEAHLVVSDQRMPSMTGTEFLIRVKQMWPDSVRVILSGYADLDSILQAINEGHVYRFLTKPWNDDQIKTDIHQCLDEYELRRQHKDMVAFIEQQNISLTKINDLKTDSLRLAHLIMEQIPIAMICVGADGMVVVINEEFNTGFPDLSASIIGKKVTGLLPSELLDGMEQSHESPDKTVTVSTCLADKQVQACIKTLYENEVHRGYILLLGRADQIQAGHSAAFTTQEVHL